MNHVIKVGAIFMLGRTRVVLLSFKITLTFIFVL